MNTADARRRRVARSEIRRPPAAREPGLRGRRDPVAGARRRRQHRHLSAARRGSHPHAAGEERRASSSRSALPIRTAVAPGSSPAAVPASPTRSGSRCASGSRSSAKSSRGPRRPSISPPAARRATAQGLWVSGDFFNGLGVPALIGRTLTSGRRSPRLCGAARRPQLRILAARVRRQPVGDRPLDHARRPLLRHRRRHAGELLRRRGRPLVRRGGAAVRRAVLARRAHGDGARRTPGSSARWAG